MRKFGRAAAVLTAIALVCGTAMPAYAQQPETFFRLDAGYKKPGKPLKNLRFLKEGEYLLSPVSKKNKIDPLFMPSTAGMDQLHISGSEQYSEEQFRELAGQLREMAGNDPVYIIDLRQESHGFLNGIPVSWYGNDNEQNIGMLTEGMPVIVRSRVDDTQIWRGTISKIDRENQQTNKYADMYGTDNGSGTNYPFYVDLPTSEGLMMGQHVYLEPDLGQEDAGTAEGIWLDEWYVDESVENAPFVWVDDGEGKLVKRDVIIGERNTEMGTLQILSGLELTDLIAFPDENCTEGAKTEKAEYTSGGADEAYTGDENNALSEDRRQP